jgi:ribose 5-phosphate isomerase A
MTEALKKAAAEAALQYLPADGVIGVGTGSTVHFFIEALSLVKHKIEGAVASSQDTAKKLRAKNIPVLDLNSAGTLSLYVDGADAIDRHLKMLKGGGGAQTGEKIIAAASKMFICIADESKYSDYLNTDKTPLAIEVVPMARSFVARELVKMGATPIYRNGFVTDYGNHLLDTYQLNLTDPLAVESQLNNIPGVVCHGLFAKQAAHKLLLATSQGLKILEA